MDPKISPETEMSQPPPTPGPLTPEVEVWEPPFERWMRIADVLLRRGVPPPTKAGIPRDSKVLKH
jgi:hypothetical protein